MATRLTSSSEFASLVSKLQESPNDPYLKKMIVSHLPQMKELAKTKPLALYHLAFIYPPESALFRNTVLQAADLGCTNAMLKACELLIATKRPQDLALAKHYQQMIEKSEDTYITLHSKKLFASAPQTINEPKNSPERIKGNHVHGFFSLQPERKEMDVGLKEQDAYHP